MLNGMDEMEEGDHPLVGGIELEQYYDTSKLPKTTNWMS